MLGSRQKSKSSPLIIQILWLFTVLCLTVLCALFNAFTLGLIFILLSITEQDHWCSKRWWIHEMNYMRLNLLLPAMLSCLVLGAALEMGRAWEALHTGASWSCTLGVRFLHSQPLPGHGLGERAGQSTGGLAYPFPWCPPLPHTTRELEGVAVELERVAGYHGAPVSGQLGCDLKMKEALASLPWPVRGLRI